MTAFPYAALRPEPAWALDRLVHAVAADIGQDAAHSATLQPAAYLSPAFFALERDRLFKPGWIAVAHVSQLSDPEASTVELFGERVTVGAGGRAIAVAIDDPGGPSRSVASQIVHGFVYVNLSGDAAPLAPQLAGLSARLDRLRLGELEVAFRLDYDSQFNWKILAETFMECYHHAGAHPTTFEVNFPARLAGVSEHDALWTSGYSTARDNVPTEALLTGLPLLAVDLSEYERRSFFLYHIYPNQLIATMPDYVAWFRNQPVAPNATQLQVFLMTRPEARQVAGAEAAITALREFFVQVNDEDIAANESQQLGLGSRVAAQGRFSHLEDSLWHFAEFIRRGVASI